MKLGPVDRLLLTFHALNLLYFLEGAVLLLLAVAVRRFRDPRNPTVAESIILRQSPSTSAYMSAVFIFLTYLISCVASVYSRQPRLFHLHRWGLAASSLCVASVAFYAWIQTLRMRTSLGLAWDAETSSVRSLLQRRFDCCGYYDPITPPFTVDTACPTPLIAAQKPGCYLAFSAFGRQTFSEIWIVSLAFLATNLLLLVCASTLAERRRKQERMRIVERTLDLQGL